MRGLQTLRELDEPTIRDQPIGVVVVAAGSLLAALAILLAAAELLLGAARFGDWSQPKIVGNDRTFG